MPAATQEAIDAFADRLVEAMNHAALISMTSIGHRTGLFDAMGEVPPGRAPSWPTGPA